MCRACTPRVDALALHALEIACGFLSSGDGVGAGHGNHVPSSLPRNVNGFLLLSFVNKNEAADAKQRHGMYKTTWHGRTAVAHLKSSQQSRALEVHFPPTRPCTHIAANLGRGSAVGTCRRDFPESFRPLASTSMQQCMPLCFLSNDCRQSSLWLACSHTVFHAWYGHSPADDQTGRMLAGFSPRMPAVPHITINKRAYLNYIS